ncbi:MAG: hypothetical protein AAB414_04545 [Patescibacteria group bacterium]
MLKLSERGAIQFIVLLILLLGIIAGVYLVQKTQIFKPKATGENVEWVVPQNTDPDNCVTTKDGKKVITCPKAKFKILVPQEVSP